jgi:hypothetical protein
VASSSALSSTPTALLHGATLAHKVLRIADCFSVERNNVADNEP